MNRIGTTFDLSSAMRGAAIAVAVSLSSAVPAAVAADGYVVNSLGEVVRTLDGSCVTTRAWSPNKAIAACHPQFVQREPVELAALEPEPQRVTRFITLEADTLFDFDQATLREEGKQELDKVAQMVQDARQPKIRVIGYTDWIGTEEYNQGLSERRAQAVHDYLAQQGIGDSVIETDARGESNPIVTCEGVQGAALIDCLQPNRRSEIEFSAFEVVEMEGERERTEQMIEPESGAAGAMEGDGRMEGMEEE